MAFDEIFHALKFRNLTVKNRVFRSHVSGRFDNFDGSGKQAPRAFRRDAMVAQIMSVFNPPPFV